MRIARATMLLAGGALLCAMAGAADNEVPAYLEGYEAQYAKDPHAAAIAWFKDAKFGLFVHYTLANVLDGGKPEYLKLTAAVAEEVELNKVPEAQRKRMGVSEAVLAPVERIHAELAKQFRAENFDAGALCELALAAEMRYVTFTTKHMGRMAMYRTKTTEFNSLNSPAGRDLVGEMAEACARHGLGLFLYVPTETARTDGDFFDLNHRVLRELLTQYGPIAGIWFDGIGNYRKTPENYTRLSETFAFVRELQPQCLVSFKDGAIGEEDFVSPEHFLFPEPVKWNTPERQARWEFRLERWERVQRALWERFYKNKPAEINTVMQECYNRDGKGEPGGWINDNNARHLSADDVWFLYKTARKLNANLLMNIGPVADGSVHPKDEKALREVGKRIRAEQRP